MNIVKVSIVLMLTAAIPISMSMSASGTIGLFKSPENKIDAFQQSEIKNSIVREFCRIVSDKEIPLDAREGLSYLYFQINVDDIDAIKCVFKDNVEESIKKYALLGLIQEKYSKTGKVGFRYIDSSRLRGELLSIIKNHANGDSLRKFTIGALRRSQNKYPELMEEFIRVYKNEQNKIIRGRLLGALSLAKPMPDTVIELFINVAENEKDWKQRGMALAALAKSSNKKLVGLLIKRYRSEEDHKLQLLALRGIKSFNEEATDFLLSLIKNSDLTAEYRIRAISNLQFLNAVPPDRVIIALSACIWNHGRNTRDVAQKALDKLLKFPEKAVLKTLNKIKEEGETNEERDNAGRVILMLEKKELLIKVPVIEMPELPENYSDTLEVKARVELILSRIPKDAQDSELLLADFSGLGRLRYKFPDNLKRQYDNASEKAILHLMEQYRNKELTPQAVKESNSKVKKAREFMKEGNYEAARVYIRQAIIINGNNQEAAKLVQEIFQCQSDEMNRFIESLNAKYSN